MTARAPRPITLAEASEAVAALVARCDASDVDVGLALARGRAIATAATRARRLPPELRVPVAAALRVLATMGPTSDRSLSRVHDAVPDAALGPIWDHGNRLDQDDDPLMDLVLAAVGAGYAMEWADRYEVAPRVAAEPFEGDLAVALRALAEGPAPTGS